MEKIKLMQEVIFLAMQVQEQTDYCVFVNFSGHVKSLDIDICKSKKDYEKGIAKTHIYLNHEGSIDRLKEVKATLLGFLETKKIDTSEMDYEIEEIRHYHF